VCGLYDCGLHHQNQMIDKEKELREDENWGWQKERMSVIWICWGGDAGEILPKMSSRQSEKSGHETVNLPSSQGQLMMPFRRSSISFMCQVLSKALEATFYLNFIVCLQEAERVS
jgi:hypothetical protein